MLQYITPNDPSLFGENDAITIQNAIAAAEADGCRKLVIPRYNLRADTAQWRIDRAIQIPSDFTVVLDNCYMVQETGIYDHMFTNSLSYSEEGKTMAGEQHDITVLGVGNVVLDGGVHNHLMEKTSGRYGLPRVWKNTMFYWVNVRNLRVENLFIQNQRWWAITHIFCRDAVYKNITFEAVPHVPNMDGIDLRIGCNNFHLENITGRTGDDVIAMTALKGAWEVDRQVEGKDTHIHHVNIRNVLGDPFIHFVVRILNHDGNEIYDIDLDSVYDVSDFTTKKRARCTVGIGGVLYSKVRMAAPGETRNVRARNLTSRGDHAVRIDNTLHDSLFTNVKTFGDNLIGVGTQKGTELHNVLFEDFYYGITQQEIFCSTALDPSGYIGSVVELPDCRGDITFKNLHVDKVDTVVRTGGPIDVSVDGYACVCARKTADLDGGKLILDGKEITND